MSCPRCTEDYAHVRMMDDYTLERDCAECEREREAKPHWMGAVAAFALAILAILVAFCLSGCESTDKDKVYFVKCGIGHFASIDQTERGVCPPDPEALGMEYRRGYVDGASDAGIKVMVTEDGRTMFAVKPIQFSCEYSLAPLICEIDRMLQ